MSDGLLDGEYEKIIRIMFGSLSCRISALVKYEFMWRNHSSK